MKPESELVAKVSSVLTGVLGQSGLSGEVQIENDREVTEDGYRADLAIETEDKVLVFDVKSGSGAKGERGPEIIPSGLAIRNAVARKHGKDAFVVFVSRGGAAEYVKKGLSTTSGSTVYGTDRASLSALRQYVSDSLRTRSAVKHKPAHRTFFGKGKL